MEIDILLPKLHLQITSVFQREAIIAVTREARQPRLPAGLTSCKRRSRRPPPHTLTCLGRRRLREQQAPSCCHSPETGQEAPESSPARTLSCHSPTPSGAFCGGGSAPAREQEPGPPFGRQGRPSPSQVGQRECPSCRRPGHVRESHGEAPPRPGLALCGCCSCGCRRRLGRCHLVLAAERKEPQLSLLSSPGLRLIFPGRDSALPRPPPPAAAPLSGGLGAGAHGARGGARGTRCTSVPLGRWLGSVPSYGALPSGDWASSRPPPQRQRHRPGPACRAAAAIGAAAQSPGPDPRSAPPRDQPPRLLPRFPSAPTPLPGSLLEPREEALAPAPRRRLNLSLFPSSGAPKAPCSLCSRG
ncbi:basic proline-rich protein-like [Chrysemys picta bellii]|uniref:basic proline-rich protein-like n=1 Tax=Chrysemys picta bellii TaxID=8478 RepID=UPI0032B16A6C